MPRFISTNRALAGGFKESVGFRDALFMGQAPDMGLFVPEKLPTFSNDELMALKGKPFRETAYTVMKAFLADEIDYLSLRAMTDEAYRFEIPLEFAGPGAWLMRLDRGPTASFKDIAALMLARLMAHLREGGKPFTVLVATSGDTGSAVGHAFKGVPGTQVVILYPEQEVSPSQKRQLDTIGGNVSAIAIDGKFDDCQRLVKTAFADEELGVLNLTSANSINFGRILPQACYYVHAYAQLADPDEEIVFSIPSGNFGNAFAAELARGMGVPIKRIVLATNANDAFPRFLANGTYEKVAPSRECISNAMNVGHASNLARFFHAYGGVVDKDGKVHKAPKLEKMREALWSVSVSDNETRAVMKEVHTSQSTLLEPHGAVGWKGLDAYRTETRDDTLAVILETAHPAKFPEIVKEVLGLEPEVPESLADLDSRTGEPDRLPADYEALKTHLMRVYAPAIA